MKKKTADALGLVGVSGKKTPEAVQARLKQRATIVPSKKDGEKTRRNGKGRRAWEEQNTED